MSMGSIVKKVQEKTLPARTSKQNIKLLSAYVCLLGFYILFLRVSATKRGFYNMLMIILEIEKEARHT